MDSRLPIPKQKPVIVQAYEGLKAMGHSVEPCQDIPGLFNVDGRELTCGQMIHLAEQAGVRFSAA